MTDITQMKLTRGAMAHAEFTEKAQELSREGFGADEILAGLAALMNDLVAGATNQATASAYFYGLAKQAALIAGAEMGFEPDT